MLLIYVTIELFKFCWTLLKINFVYLFTMLYTLAEFMLFILNKQIQFINTNKYIVLYWSTKNFMLNKRPMGLNALTRNPIRGLMTALNINNTCTDISKAVIALYMRGKDFFKFDTISPLLTPFEGPQWPGPSPQF